MHGGSGNCRQPLLGLVNEAEPLPQAAGRWGLGLLPQDGGLGAPATAADTPLVAVVGQSPVHWQG